MITSLTKDSNIWIAKPIFQQVNEHDKEQVLTFIYLLVETLSDRLDVEISEKRLRLISQDILEVYKYDSIEDIKICLKNAGQGLYDWGLLKRGSITMEHIKYWMSFYLEEKAIKRENIIKNRKHDEYELPQVDYESYKIKEAEKREAEEKKRHSPEDVRKQAEQILQNNKL